MAEKSFSMIRYSAKDRLKIEFSSVHSCIMVTENGGVTFVGACGMNYTTNGLCSSFSCVFYVLFHVELIT